MGVPGLASFIYRYFSKCTQTFQQGEQSYVVDHLYIDTNAIIHTIAQIVYGYGEKKRVLNRYSDLDEYSKMIKVFEITFDTIVEIVKMVFPRKTLVIAIDGPAPLAKQAQQRQRRFVAARSRVSESEEERFVAARSRVNGSEEGRFVAARSRTNGSEEEQSKSDSETPRKFDSNSITPGSIFLFELSKYFNYRIRLQMNSNTSYSKNWSRFNVVFSPATVPGEGEHKIMNFIRSNKEFRNDSHCFFGPDGDLFMLTLSIPLREMYLLREEMNSIAVYKITRMQYRKRLDTDKNPYFRDNNYNVSSMLVDKLRQSHLITNRIRTESNIINDFILIGFFIGNDFLPKIQMFYTLDEGLNGMIERYIKIFAREQSSFLTGFSNGKYVPDLIGFTKFVSGMEKIEKDSLLKQATIVPSEEKFKDTPLLESILYDKYQHPINIDINIYRRLYYGKSNIDITTRQGKEQINQMCLDYIKSFFWVFEYYVNGLVSWTHYYKWNYAPLMVDLLSVLSNLTDKQKQFLSSFESGAPHVPFVQLLSVLPPASANILPIEYSQLLTEQNSPLVKSGINPTEFKIDYEGKTKDHMAIVLLPFADSALIEREYNKIKPKFDYKRNKIGKEYLFSYKQDRLSKYICKFGIIPFSRVVRTEI